MNNWLKFKVCFCLMGMVVFGGQIGAYASDETEIQNVLTQLGQYAAGSSADDFMSLFSSNYLHCGTTYEEMAEDASYIVADVKTLDFSVGLIEVQGNYASVSGTLAVVMMDDSTFSYIEPDPTDEGLGLGWMIKEDGQWRFFGKQVRTDWAAVNLGHNLTHDNQYLRAGFNSSFAVNQVSVSGPYIDTTVLEYDSDRDSYKAYPVPTQFPIGGESYAFEVEYTDGVHETVYDQVGANVDTAPVVTVAYTNGTPVFSWNNAGSSVPNFEELMLSISGAGVYWEVEDIPIGSTSIVFNADGSASGTFVDGEHYTASLYLFNEHGDFAYTISDFTMDAGGLRSSYEVFGTDSYTGADMGYNPASYGLSSLGTADGSTTFSGAYNFYIIKPTGSHSIFIDAARGSNGQYAPELVGGNFTTGNSPNWDEAFSSGVPDGIGQQVGIQPGWPGFYVVDASDKGLSGITVYLAGSSEPATSTYAVTFDLGTNGTHSGGGALVQQVVDREAATAPSVTANEGWWFEGWDVAFTNVTGDLSVHAQYQKLPTYLEWSISGGEVTIDDCDTATAGAMEIPSTIEGYPVTAIGDWAFDRCHGLMDVTIPDSVITIGDHAFYNCDGLTDITISDSVTAIGDWAFSDCDGLKDIIVDLANPVYCSVNGVLFSKDQEILVCYPADKSGSYTIPPSVNTIGNAAFSGCDGLSDVSIHVGVNSLGIYAFSGCNNLIDITIPSSVNSIGVKAFSYCTGLTSIFVDVANPAYCSVDGILFSKNQKILFCYPSSKNGIYTIPTSVTIIDDAAFAYCNGLTSVVIPIGVTSIGNRAFMSCSALTGITIPTSVTTIDDWAFRYCSALMSATFAGDAPASFGSSVFYGTSSEFTVYYYEGAEGFATPTWNEYPSAIKSATYVVEFDLGNNGARTGGGGLMQEIAEGEAAEVPAVLPNEGWLFQGWDADFGNITTDMVVNAIYEAYSADSGPIVTWSENGHRYQAEATPDGITWAEAQANAAARGGYLATANSAAENNFIFSLVQYTNFWSGNFGPWLGVLQPMGSREPDGDWVWVSGDQMVYSNWNEGEPNNYNGIEHRAHYFKKSNIWNDVTANRLILGYVVEYQISPSATGSLAVAISGETGVVTGVPLKLDGLVDGVANRFAWDFGDGTSDSNIQFTAHAWTAPGEYEVVFTAYNGARTAGVSASQTIHVVSLENSVVYVAPEGLDENDGFSWLNAKASVQAGVDAAVGGGTILVSNGTYSIATEITVDKSLTIESVGGPEEVIIDCDDLCRGFSFGASSSILNGVTVTNGFTEEYGGGIFCAGTSSIITNCIIVDCVAGIDGGGVVQGSVYDSTITQNTAYRNGGGLNQSIAYGCALSFNIASNNGGALMAGNTYGCTISSNTAGGHGGGLNAGNIYDSVIELNSAARWGGGVNTFTATVASNCVIRFNTAADLGGGVRGGIVYCSEIYGNSSATRAGGVQKSTIYDSLIDSNSAGTAGGGIRTCIAFNCTIVNNQSGNGGGGARDSDLYNCIVVGNTAGTVGPNLNGIIMISNSCSPDVEHGVGGNITNMPLFVDELAGDYRLMPNSPCINWGNNAYGTSSLDLDGNPGIVESYVDMGCYEYQGIVGLDGDGDSNGVEDSWEREHFSGHVDPDADADGDGQSNFDEYISGMDPTNKSSVMEVELTVSGATNQLAWYGAEGRFYQVEYTEDLSGGWLPLDYSVMEGLDALMTLADASPVSNCFYRVRVSMDASVFPELLTHDSMMLIPSGINSGTDPEFGAYSLTNDAVFYMDSTEVTKAQWDTVYNWAVTNGYRFDNAGEGKALSHPVQTVNWYDCVKWCNARSEMEGRTPCYAVDGVVYTVGQSTPDCNFSANGYRLPTSDEWEYAARGGLSGKHYPWGDSISHSMANYEDSSQGYHPLYRSGNYPYTSPTGSFSANGYGLYDMSGNVWEWCWDTADIYRYVRGGSWFSPVSDVSCGYANWDDTNYAQSDRGFRAVNR